jgi:uncharacterized membrane protein (DUF4010 family)
MPVESPQADVETWFFRLAIALAIGLLIGVERGWKERDEPDGGRTAGVRTFSLIGLFGGVAALLSETHGPLILAVAFVALAAAMIPFEILNARAEGSVDATPLIAQLLVFALGAAAGLGHIQLAGAAAVAVAMILAFKESLHSWLERITFKELSAGLVLAAMTVIVLPLLPAEPVDPWNAVSPRDIWLLTLLIAAIHFVGYAAMRIVGPEHGPLVAGLAGGLVSSTAAVLSFSRLAKGRDDPGSLAAGALAANIMMFIRIGVVATALRPEIALPIAAAIVPAALAGVAAVAFLLLRSKRDKAATMPDPKNPLSLRTAFVFAALLTGISLAAAFLNETVGAAGTLALAAVSGLADVDAITLSMTQSAAIAAQTAVIAILIAASVNTVVKSVLAWMAGGRGIGLTVATASAASLVAAAVGLSIYLVSFASTA